MEIIAKAKPIQFRIVSSGVECASLDDLKEHFDIKSIAETIKDGRLAKWLDRIGQSDIAHRIKDIKEVNVESSEDIIKVITAITGTNYLREKGISDLDYILQLDKDQWTKCCAELIIKETMLKNQEVLLYAYHHHIDLVKNPISYFGTFLDKGNPEVLWIYGKHQFAEKEEKGFPYIKMAASKGSKDAQKFLQNHSYISKEVVGKKIAEVLNNCRELKTCLHILSLLSEDTSTYDEEAREVFELCHHYINGFYNRCTTSIGIFEAANSQFVKEVGRFLYLYAHEKNYALSVISSRYNQINLKPSKQRASQFKHGFRYRNMFIETKYGIKIDMPENPSGSEYKDFVIEFLSNIYNF